MSTSFLSIRDLCKSFDASEENVVQNLSLDVERGEIFALLGPSGCGKTTTLRIIAGLEEPDHGEIVLDGNRLSGGRKFIPPEKRGVGMVFQSYALFPHLKVRENVQFGLRSLGADEQQVRTEEALRLVQLIDRADRATHELSGGEQQRVALARALAPAPKLLLLDEPFSNLDASLRVETRQEMRELLKRTDTTVILVTHDQTEAISFADRLGVLHEGSCLQVGSPEEVYSSPRTQFVAQFLGDTNLVRVHASDRTAETFFGPVALAESATGEICISLRPEQFDLQVAQPNTPTGCVAFREFCGDHVRYGIQFAADSLLVRASTATSFDVGDQVCVHSEHTATVIKHS